MDNELTFLANKPNTALSVKEDVVERPKPLALSLEPLVPLALSPQPKHLIVSDSAILERFKKMQKVLD